MQRLRGGINPKDYRLAALNPQTGQPYPAMQSSTPEPLQWDPMGGQPSNLGMWNMSGHVQDKYLGRRPAQEEDQAPWAGWQPTPRMPAFEPNQGGQQVNQLENAKAFFEKLGRAASRVPMSAPLMQDPYKSGGSSMYREDAMSRLPSEALNYLRSVIQSLAGY
jgi:hypothetical protein